MRGRERARSEEEKALRRAALLRTAGILLESIPYSKITMADVAERAGLAKGTVYLYFESKEELFLALLEELLFAWYEAIDRELTEVRGELATADLLAILDRVSLEQPPMLSRLLAITSAILEHNVRFEVASRYKRRLWTQMTATGAKLEAKWPPFRPGEGFHFLGMLGVFIIGARQLADVAPVVTKVIDAFDLKGFRVDFRAEVTGLIENHLRGLEHRADRARKQAVKGRSALVSLGRRM